MAGEAQEDNVTAEINNQGGLRVGAGGESQSITCRVCTSVTSACPFLPSLPSAFFTCSHSAPITAPSSQEAVYGVLYTLSKEKMDEGWK